MRHNANRNGIMERRRRLVMAALVRNPTATQRQIQEAVGKQIDNIETGKPYALGTIHNDIQMVRKGWERQAQRDYGVWVAEELARLYEVEEEGWKRGDFDLVLKCSDRRCKLKGLHAPERFIINWRQEAEEAGLDPSEIFERYIQAAADALTGSESTA